MTKATLESTPLGFNLEEMVNPQFSKAKIYVMYHGKNPNGTNISKEAVDRNIKSIKNIPIVGEFSKENSNFKGHGGTIEIDEYGDMEYIHTTSPIGVIPESANIYWETVKDKKEIEREYLVVDGAYMWNRYSKQVSALKEDNYGQSMEIEITNGQWNDDKVYYDITDFVFSALCVLGIDKNGSGHVEPAFSDAKIITYNNKGFKEELDEMIKEFKFSLNQEKEVNSLNLEALLEKHSLTLEQLEEKGINPEDFEKEEDLESKILEVFKEEEKEDKDVEDAPEEQVTEVTIGHKQIDEEEQEEIQKTEGSVDGGDGDTGTAGETTDSVSTEVTSNTTATDGDNTQVTDANFEDIKSQLESALEKIKELESEVEQYQKKEHEEKANDLINSFKENFGLEDKDVSFDIHELELEKLESKLYEIVGRKASKLAKEKEGNSKRFSLESTDEQNVQSVPYASLFEKL